MLQTIFLDNCFNKLDSFTIFVKRSSFFKTIVAKTMIYENDYRWKAGNDVTGHIRCGFWINFLKTINNFTFDSH